MGKKIYAVRVGKIPGIYYSWDECKSMVDGYPKAEYKSFSEENEAKKYLGQKSENEILDYENIAIAYVDGSFSRDLKKYAYGCIIQYKGQQYELSGAGADKNYIEMNNVAGELLGSMNAIKWAINNNVKKINIFYDYEGIEKWANDEWKANKEGTLEYKNFIKRCRENVEITFTKVVAHTGIELNEQADKLAKKALMENEKKIFSTAEKIFVNIMSGEIDEKDKRGIAVDKFIINEKRVIEYVKELWTISGKKKSNIKTIDYFLDLNKKEINIQINDKNGKFFQETVKLENIL